MDGSDDDLIRQFRQGQRSDAFGVLVRRYQDRLYRTIYRLSDDTAEAEDLVQESFLTAYQKLHDYRGGGFYMWLYRIGIRTALERWREKWKPSSLE